MEDKVTQRLSLKHLRISLSAKHRKGKSFEDKHRLLLEKKRSRSIINCKNILSFDLKEEIFSIKDNKDLYIEKVPDSPINREEEWVLELTSLLSEKKDQNLHIPVRRPVSDSKAAANPVFSGYSRKCIPLIKRKNNK